MLENRQAAVISEEQASLKSLQEKRDAAVSAITIAMEKHRKPCCVKPAGATHEVQRESSMSEAKPLDFIPLENTEDNMKPFKNGVVEINQPGRLVEADTHGFTYIRQAADLCRSLGLSERMPGVIDVLINNGRHIDAVNLAFAFELTDKFSPVSLLKSYLNENDVNEKQLTALREAVIKFIEDHKLGRGTLWILSRKRVLQLEKEKADKKREQLKLQTSTKRPRANCIANGARVTNHSTHVPSFPCYLQPSSGHLPPASLEMVTTTRLLTCTNR
ncbi:hypothetical protein HAX54_051029 [Datura stramonium]|uniref:FRIGIDA-like protein n=1 Tax=Datura stramonium TaxID=4076 RepID=A0ABS8RUJ8_DATST|nr:hypothetical protein [Datura stramonium]